jgi:hypothetical protein
MDVERDGPSDFPDSWARHALELCIDGFQTTHIAPLGSWLSSELGTLLLNSAAAASERVDMGMSTGTGQVITE